MIKIVDQITPGSAWVKYLCANDMVWLVKEKCFAWVQYLYDWHPGSTVGQIGLLREDDGPDHRWHVRQDGTGMDFKPLLLPTENVPMPFDEMDEEIGELGSILDTHKPYKWNDDQKMMRSLPSIDDWGELA